MSASLFAAGVTLAVASIGAASSPITWKPANGYGPLKLGMTYEDALQALPNARWNSVAKQACDEDMPVRGCLLSQFQSPLAYKIDAIPFSPVLSFNNHGNLTDLILNFERNERITSLECRSIYGRVVDWVASNYGPVAFPTKTDAKPENWPHTLFTSAIGVRYPISFSPKSRSFIAGGVRSNLDGVQLPSSLPLTEWNDLRYVSASGDFIVVDGKPNCSVMIQFSEPASVKRSTQTASDLP